MLNKLLILIKFNRIPASRLLLFILFNFVCVANLFAAGNPATILSNLVVPWEIAFLSEDTIILTERSGYLSFYKKNGEVIKKIKIDKVAAIGEGGLLGMAIHPDFDFNHWIYLYRTTEKLGKNYNQVLRYELINDEIKNEKVIIDEIPAGYIHNGGRIAFGPDSYLYVTTGDAGNTSFSQDKKSLAGKILRVKDNGDIPDLNPFGNAVYSYGHRNPQGIAWDEAGRLWSTEHGPTGFDKINLIEKGSNYGWPVVSAEEQKQGVVPPVLHSGKDTWAPAGLAFWRGKLYFGGLRGESLFEYDPNVSPGQLTPLLYKEYGRIRAVVVGPDKYLYFSTSNLDGRGQLNNKGDDKILMVE